VCYRSAALRRKKREDEDEAGTALVPEGSRGNVAWLTQRDIARRMAFPKQTVNFAVAKM
jgi:hypothetical protein